MYSLNPIRKPLPRFFKRRYTMNEWWSVRTQKQKRIIKSVILCCLAAWIVVVLVIISSDHENPNPDHDFDPDYMLGQDEKISNPYNKRMRPTFYPRARTAPSGPPNWGDIDANDNWYNKKHKSTTTSTMTETTTTATTTTTTTTTTTSTATPTTTTTPTPTTTIATSSSTTSIPSSSSTTTSIPSSSSTTTTIQTSSFTMYPTTQASNSTWPTEPPTNSITTEITSGFIRANLGQNETPETQSEAESRSLPNTLNLSVNTTELYGSATTTPKYHGSNGFSQTTKTLLVPPEASTEINLTTRRHTLSNSTFQDVEVTTQKDQSSNSVKNQHHTIWSDNEGKSTNSQESEHSTPSTTSENTPSKIMTTPPTTTIQNVFHLNASMAIESEIDSETIGSAARHHHHSKRPPTPKTTPQAPTVMEVDEATSFSYPQSNVCLEDECFLVARKLNESIDQNIKPCENFYQHVCGNWDRMEPSPSEHIGISVTVLSEDIKSDLKGLLSQPPLQYDSKAVKNVKTLYSACVTRVSSNRISLIQLQKAMGEMTNFVRKSKDHGKGPDLGKLATHLIRLHNNYLFPIGVVKDSKNVSRNVLHIGINKPLLLKKKNYESRLPYFNALRDLITEIANIMGVKTIIHKVLGFELLLSQITPDSNGDFENEYNPTTIGELESTTNVAWRNIFQSALDLTGENISIGLNETVIVQSPEYLKKLLALLKDSDESDLIDYSIIRFVLPKLDAMPDEFYKLYQRYKRVLSGIEDENRHLSCVIFAGNMMPGVVGKIYSDRYFSEAVKYRNIHVPKMIHATALDLVRKLTWMDRPSKLEALKKLYSMLQMIGNDQTLSGNPLINQFQFMNDHMKNLFILDKYRMLRTFSQLRTPNLRGKWAINSHPFEMRSFYSPQQNTIYIPAAMFQQPLFHDDLPLTMQFGALGSTVGHAYIHALDVIGSKFDDNGNMRNWWSNRTMANFHSKIGALESYTLQDFDDKDIIESSADIGGVKISWRALKKMQKEFNLKPMILPGLNYTSDQLFYINYARAWCNEEIMTHAMDSVGHSPKLPAKNRVIITLQNMKSFSDTFRCKVGDYMNPKDKTHIW